MAKMKSLLLIMVFTFLYSCNLPITSGNGTFEFNGNVSEGGNEQQVSTDPAKLPIINEPSPFGAVNSDIGSVVLSVKTDKASICRYDKNDGAYGSLQYSLQADAQGLSHSALAMVAPQTFYKYFVKCRSMNSGAENTISRTIEFSTMGNSDISPPMLSNAQPSGILPATTRTVSLSISSNERSQCRYDATNKPYVMMNSQLQSANGINHSASINVQTGTGYVYFVHCSDEKGNITSTPSLIQFYVDKAGSVDTTGPVISNLLPASGTKLPEGTKQVTISLSTNEAATCKTSSSAQATYDQMQAMQVSGSQNHSHIQTGLMDLSTYVTYVQCRDQANNLSQKMMTTYSVEKNVVVFNAASYYQVNCQNCHGAAATSNKRNTTAALIQQGIDLNKGGMGQFNTLTPAQVQALAALLQDNAPAQAAVISNTQPWGSQAENTASVTVSAQTDVAASCRFDATDLPYASMTYRLSADGLGTTHTAMFAVESQKDYRLYIRCQTPQGGTNMMSSLVNFDTKMGVDMEAPMISSPLPSGVLPETTTSVDLRVTTNEKAECKYDTTNKMYSLMAFDLDFSGDKLQHTKSVNVQKDTAYTFYVGCSDEKGNITLQNSVISFRVDKEQDVVAPLLSGFMPGGELAEGTTQTVISLNTNEPANCRYSTNGAATFAQMTAFMTTGAMAHNSSVAGLENGRMYDFFVYCQDMSGNTSAQGKIAFSVKAAAALNGAALYAANCASCHGVNIAQSNLKGRAQDTGAEYQAGIDRINAMAFLRGTLSIAQLDAIAAAVNQQAPPPPPSSAVANSQSVVLTRRGIASKMMTIFSNGNNDFAEQRIDDRILEENNGFLGGTCTPYEDNSDCPGASEEARVNSPMLPNISSIRRSLIYSACTEVISNDNSANTALSRADLTANSGANEANVRKLGDLFFPGVNLDQQVASGLVSLHQEARTSNLDNRDSWKMVMLAMCQSSLFENY